MRRGLMIGVMVGALGLLAGGASAAGQGERILCPSDVAREMTINYQLRHYVERNGMPDVAASQFLSDERPWSERQVTLYYFGLRKEIGFAKAYILGSRTISIERYERDLSDADIASLEPLANPSACEPVDEMHVVSTGYDEYPPGYGEGTSPGARAEAAAARAEAAARRVEAAATRTEESAARAEAAVDRLMQMQLRR
jgi:hypothetical protein